MSYRIHVFLLVDLVADDTDPRGKPSDNRTRRSGKSRVRDPLGHQASTPRTGPSFPVYRRKRGPSERVFSEILGAALDARRTGASGPNGTTWNRALEKPEEGGGRPES